MDQLKIDKLREYARIEGTEQGEAWLLLGTLAEYPDYVSYEFAEALEKEIDKHLKFIWEHCRIEEHTETETHIYKTLEWIEGMPEG